MRAHVACEDGDDSITVDDIAEMVNSNEPIGITIERAPDNDVDAAAEAAAEAAAAEARAAGYPLPTAAAAPSAMLAEVSLDDDAADEAALEAMVAEAEATARGGAAGSS